MIKIFLINIETCENIKKITTGQEDDCRIGCLQILDYSYFKQNFKMTEVHLSKQQALDADLTAIQQITAIVNLDSAGNTTMFFIIKKAKEIVLNFSQGTVKVL